jgi:hypothetical protein
VRLDDLDGVEEAGGDGRQRGREDGAEREVRHDDDTRVGLGLDRAAQRRDAVAGPSGRAHEHLPAVGDREVDDALADRGDRHVDDHVGRQHLLRIAPGAQPGDELELVGGVDQRAGQRAESAGRTDDGDGSSHSVSVTTRLPTGAGAAPAGAVAQ